MDKTGGLTKPIIHYTDAIKCFEGQFMRDPERMLVSLGTLANPDFGWEGGARI